MRRLLAFLALPAVALIAIGAPGWLFLWDDARAWADHDVVTASVADDAECRVGPVPERSHTCDATWTVDGDQVEGFVSNRYGGARPEPGQTLEARLVDDDLAVVAFRPWLRDYALATPFLTLGGVVLLALTVPALPGRSWRGRPESEGYASGDLPVEQD